MCIRDRINPQTLSFMYVDCREYRGCKLLGSFIMTKRQLRGEKDHEGLDKNKEEEIKTKGNIENVVGKM